MGRSQPSQLSLHWNASHEFVDAIRARERQSLANELHDTVIQPLTMLFTSFECMPYNHQQLTPAVCQAYMDSWKELVREAIDSLRGTVAGLHSHPHAELGLPEALRRYLASRIRCHGLRMTADVMSWPDNLPLDITTGLYLVAREALTNAEKYAKASLVSVVLRANTRILSVIISDDGIGMYKEKLAHQSRSAGSGRGIAGMRTRVHELGGKLALSTAPGRGVRIDIRVPYYQRVTSDGRSDAVRCAGG